MRILFLAPQPFFQERGTPIAVRLAIQVLGKRLKKLSDNNDSKDQIDLLTYHEGEQIELPGVTVHRIKAPGWIRNVGPGISIKKLLCDVIFLFTCIRMVRAAKPHGYDLVHAVEESVFIAMLIKLFWRIPYIYDMDSSIAMQLTEKWWLLRPLAPLLSYFERLAVRHSMAVVPVCDALAVLANRHGASDTQILRDISLISSPSKALSGQNLLKHETGLKESDQLILYIGNLEPYQGVQLLVESFASIMKEVPNAHVVIIGGSDQHIEEYKSRIEKLGATSQIHLLGRRPLTKLGEYLCCADVLASPRVRGNNTPMKIYSYLHSGVPIIATDLPTHTQVLDQSVAQLSSVETEDFAKGLLKLLTDKKFAFELGARARKLAEERYTFEVFERGLNSLYDRVDRRLQPQLLAANQ